mgnify:CR=1 FL=1
MLRRLMSARVEVWLLLLLALAFLAGLVFYGSLVRAAALGFPDPYADDLQGKA